MECKNSDLVTEWCNDLIETSDRGYRFKDDERLRPCKEYDQEFIDWKIEKHSSSSITEPLYWIWFMCTAVALVKCRETPFLMLSRRLRTMDKNALISRSVSS
jgi:hypothetical protein